MICIPNTEEMTQLPPHRTTVWVAVEGERAMLPVDEVRATCSICGAPATVDSESFVPESNDVHGWVYGSVTSSCTAHPHDPRHIDHTAFHAKVEGVVLISMAVRDEAVDAAMDAVLKGYGRARLYRTLGDPRARLLHGDGPLPDDAQDLCVLRDEGESGPLAAAMDEIVRTLATSDSVFLAGGDLREMVWQQIRLAIGVEDPVEASWTIIREGVDLPRDLAAGRPSVIGMTEAEEYAAWARFYGDEPLESVGRRFGLVDIEARWAKCCADGSHDEGWQFERFVDNATGRVTVRCAECGAEVDPDAMDGDDYSDGEIASYEVPVGRDA